MTGRSANCSSLACSPPLPCLVVPCVSVGACSAGHPWGQAPQRAQKCTRWRGLACRHVPGSQLSCAAAETDPPAAATALHFQGELKFKNLTGSPVTVIPSGLFHSQTGARESRAFRAAGQTGSPCGQGSTGAQVITSLYAAVVLPTTALSAGGCAGAELQSPTCPGCSHCFPATCLPRYLLGPGQCLKVPGQNVPSLLLMPVSVSLCRADFRLICVEVPAPMISVPDVQAVQPPGCSRC